MIPQGDLPDCILTKWTVSGEALVVGAPCANVKLAGFYTSGYDFYYASQGDAKYPSARLASNVVDLGLTGGAFILGMDASAFPASPGDFIYLIMWADVNGNDACDPGVEWKYVIPLFEDPVFQNATDCIYYFDGAANQELGTRPGWNQSIGLNRYAGVVETREGTRLSNESPWRDPPHGGGGRRLSVSSPLPLKG